MPEEPLSNPFPTLRPTGAERKAVLEEIATLEDDKRQVFKSIRETTAHLILLKRKSKTLEYELTTKRASISPMLWVPLDVLGCIFEQCVEVSGIENYITLANLQLVSKFWHSIVKNSPRLWTRIDLVGPFHLNNLSSHRQHIDSHALRSRRLPLRVTFWGGVVDNPDPRGPEFSMNWILRNEGGRTVATSSTEAKNLLLEYLTLSTSDRWISFDLRCVQPHYSYIFSHGTKLRHLALNKNSDSLDPRNKVTQNSLLPLLCSHYSNSTTLRSLDLFNISLDLQPSLPPLISVQELDIGFLSDQKWGALLYDGLKKPWISLFPQLRKLTLNACSSANVPRPVFNGRWERWGEIQHLIRTEVYEAKYLLELCLRGPVPSWALCNIALPALKTVRVEMNKRASHILAPHLLLDARDTDWGTVSLGTVRNLYLSCKNCDPFWFTQRDLEYARNINYTGTSWYSNLEKIRTAFSPFHNVEMLNAPSCVWRQIGNIFGSKNEDVQRAGEGSCSEFIGMSGGGLSFLLQGEAEEDLGGVTWTHTTRLKTKLEKLVFQGLPESYVETRAASSHTY